VTSWTHAEYRDFHEFPRALLCTCGAGTFYFLSRLDPASGKYAGYYEVYRLPALSDSEVCASWFGLETRAVRRLADLPLRAFPFDVSRREFLEYDSIAELLQ
jgi:hypothetical protein